MLKVRITLTVTVELDISPGRYGDDVELTLPNVARIERESYLDDPHMFFDSIINAEGMKDSITVELCAPSS